MQPPPYPAGSVQDVPTLIDRWVAAGFLSPEQAARIRADYAAFAPQRPVSLVAEGLGYLGGVIVVIGLSLALNLAWDQIIAEGRVGITAGTAAALILAGALIPAARLGGTGRRLRGVLWLAGASAVFPSIMLAADTWLDWQRDDQVALLAAGGTAVASAVLWAFNRHVLQHLATVVSVGIVAFTGTAMATDDWLLTSLAVWGVGVVWFILSLPNLIPQRGGGVLGALSATIGGLMMLGEEWGPVIALATMVALVLTAVGRRELALLAVSSIGTLIVLPFVVERYTNGDVLVTALALVVAGLALVAIGVYTARRRTASPV